MCSLIFHMKIKEKFGGKLFIVYRLSNFVSRPFYVKLK